MTTTEQQTTDTDLALGYWARVTSGHQRGQMGVVDLIEHPPVGTRVRLSNPHEKRVVGRFDPAHLARCAPPAYESRVDEATREHALWLLTGGALGTERAR